MNALVNIPGRIYETFAGVVLESKCLKVSLNKLVNYNCAITITFKMLIKLEKRIKIVLF